MPATTAPNVRLIASTTFHGWMDEDLAPADQLLPEFQADPEGSDAAAVIEFAGRACYQAFHRPNPDTATPLGYLANIMDKGHGSVLEHATCTFYITGVSRALTHELIRHRHLSFSELSQRYVDVAEAPMVLPPALEVPGDDEVDGLDAARLLEWSMDDARGVYERLTEYLQAHQTPRKQSREAARAALPNATETRIVVTGNLRAWRNFLLTRGTEYADAEMRRLAVSLWELLREEAPEAFQDVECMDGCLESTWGRV